MWIRCDIVGRVRAWCLNANLFNLDINLSLFINMENILIKSNSRKWQNSLATPRNIKAFMKNKSWKKSLYNISWHEIKMFETSTTRRRRRKTKQWEKFTPSVFYHPKIDHVQSIFSFKPSLDAGNIAFLVCMIYNRAKKLRLTSLLRRKAAIN